MGSNTSSQDQNLISTVQIVVNWVSNLSSKFQLDRTTDEVESTPWWNLGSEMCFSFRYSLLSVFPFFPIFFCFCLFVFFYFFIVTDLGPKNMGPTPSHTREPYNKFI